MKTSEMFLTTLREVPAEAEIPSHILLLRAGFIKKLVSGIYSFLPLGNRTLKKIEAIVREEMDAAGAQEILMSALQPAELWQESGRWGVYGPEMWRIKDRNQREFCLGPTHEEIFTDIVRQAVSSYRQLPLNLYQIQTKYRDEARPRFGLMRSREFIMKDAYSFDRDEAGLDVSYKKMYDAYSKVFTRCGLNFRPVEADSGAIGGNNSHEFTALSEVGESEIVYCSECDFAATSERAEFKDEKQLPETAAALEKVSTPGTKTIEAVCKYLEADIKHSIKALLLQVAEEEGDKVSYVLALVRGDRQLNMTKLVNALDVPEYLVSMADEEKMSSVTGCVGGFTGPIGIHDCMVIMDSELSGSVNMVCGANEKDFHYTGVCEGRDFKADKVVDLKLLQAGDPCPCCGKPVKTARGIEVGQVFKLGTKYSEPMNCLYRDENQVDHPVVMGCYGIGVSRTMAAVVEQHHDDNGIIWPMSIAPYHVDIVIAKADDPVQKALAEDIENKLEALGVEVMLDDRDERPGVKFKDADLIGIPIRITVGKKAGEGIVEYKLRRGGDMEELEAAEAVSKAAALVNAERRG
ncbi:MAG: proline--tRNA ligase [Firmicutes bacterium]|nr:proline--tRNA ligase [Bacillota bacterium]